MTVPVTACDNLAQARERIRIGPVPSWVAPCTFDPTFKAEQNQTVTTLLVERQVQLETDESFVRCVSRFESMEAVQQNSQWRCEFEPNTQSITLHFIKVHRSGKCIDQLDLGKSHVLQREEGLNRLVIDGRFTFLQILEDVRPGDIVEWAFTAKNTRRILPEHRDGWFLIPEWTSVGKYHFIVRFDAARNLQWKSSSADIVPKESSDGGVKVWTWAGEKHCAPTREAQIPSTFMGAVWLQYSDCPSWHVASAAIFEHWSRQVRDEPFDDILTQIPKRGTTQVEHIVAAIELIQDEYRYLSVNLEFGGQTPTSPRRVAQRRYGDCKDLAFLLVKMLTCLGVKARPVLVHTQLRKAVKNLLPTTNLFNHAVVEFEAEGKKRWVDATAKYQGGGAFGRYISDFGFGLAVDRNAESLVESPVTDEVQAVNEYHETILLDTQGNPSALAIVSHYRGPMADFWRNQLRNYGEEDISKREAQIQANRFGACNIKGLLLHRDNRETNELTTAQTFEIFGFLRVHPNKKNLVFGLPFNWVGNSLLLPANERRMPLALQKGSWIHSVEIQSPAISLNFRQNITPRFKIENSFFEFQRLSKFGFGSCMAKCSLTISRDTINVDEFEEYRAAAQEAAKEALITLSVPAGYPKVKPSRRFGALPELITTPTPLSQSQGATIKNADAPVRPVEAAPDTPPASQATSVNAEQSGSGRQRRRKRRNFEQKKRIANLLFAALVAVGISVMIFLLLWKR